MRLSFVTSPISKYHEPIGFKQGITPALAGRHGADATQPHFLHEPVLKDPVRTVDATLRELLFAPGASTGESDVVISVKRTKPWSLSVGADDSGLMSTGRLQGSVSLTLDNPLGLSDLLNLSYNHDINGHTSQYGTHGSSAYYSIPWGNWTLTTTASQYDYHEQIAGAFTTLVSSGKSSTFEVKAGVSVHDLYRCRACEHDQG